jgi:hypothetical protein
MSSRHQDREASLVQDRPCDPSKHPLTQFGVTIGAHDEEIGAKGHRLRQQKLSAILERRSRVKPKPPKNLRTQAALPPVFILRELGLSRVDLPLMAVIRPEFLIGQMVRSRAKPHLGQIPCRAGRFLVFSCGNREFHGAIPNVSLHPLAPR